MTAQENKDNKDNKDNKSASEDKDNNNHGKQGFASMPTEKVKEIASEGGKASHKND